MTPIRDEDRPACVCHGIPMLWQADRRRPPGGYWCCREKRREYNKRRSEQRVAWVRNRYATDFVFRAEKDIAARRRKALIRMAERHAPAEEGSTS